MKESESEVTQSCPTLCDPINCIPPGSSVHGILQARILEWVAISFSRGSSQPRDWTWVSHIVGRRFTVWATGGADDKTHLLKKDKEVLPGIPTFPLIIKLQPSKFSGLSFSRPPTCKPHKSPILINHVSSTTLLSMNSSLHWYIKDYGMGALQSPPKLH